LDSDIFRYESFWIQYSYIPIPAFEESIIAGISQGSILGPLFFSSFINGLPISNIMKTILFADDAVLVQNHNKLEKIAKLSSL